MPLLNGTYRAVGMHDGKPLFENEQGARISCAEWDNSSWKIYLPGNHPSCSAFQNRTNGMEPPLTGWGSPDPAEFTLVQREEQCIVVTLSVQGSGDEDNFRVLCYGMAGELAT